MADKAVLGIGLDTREAQSNADKLLKTLKELSKQTQKTTVKSMAASGVKNTQSAMEKAHLQALRMNEKMRKKSIQDFNKAWDRALRMNASKEAALAKRNRAEYLRDWKQALREKATREKELDRENAANRRRSETSGSGMGGSLPRMIVNTSVALQAMAGFLGARELINITAGMERVRLGFEAISGSAEQASEEFEYSKFVALRFGQDLMQTSKAYNSMAIAAKAGGLSVAETRDVFYDMSAASRSVGLSAADAAGTIKALTQSLSKGKFNAEEVRNQLGDRMPVAMQALRAAVQETTGEMVTMEQVNKKMELGLLRTSDNIVAFARKFKELTGGEAQAIKSSKLLGASLTNLGTKFQILVDKMATAGFGSGVSSLVDSLADSFSDPKVIRGVEQFGEVFGRVIDLLKENTGTLKTIGMLIATYLTGRLLTAAAAGLKLATAFEGVTGAVNILKAAITRTPLGALAVGATALYAAYKTLSSTTSEAGERLRELGVTSADVDSALGKLTKATDETTEATVRGSEAFRNSKIEKYEGQVKSLTSAVKLLNRELKEDPMAGINRPWTSLFDDNYRIAEDKARRLLREAITAPVESGTMATVIDKMRESMDSASSVDIAKMWEAAITKLAEYQAGVDAIVRTQDRVDAEKFVGSLGKSGPTAPVMTEVTKKNIESFIKGLDKHSRKDRSPSEIAKEILAKSASFDTSGSPEVAERLKSAVTKAVSSLRDEQRKLDAEVRKDREEQLTSLKLAYAKEVGSTDEYVAAMRESQAVRLKDLKSQGSEIVAAQKKLDQLEIEAIREAATEKAKAENDEKQATLRSIADQKLALAKKLGNRVAYVKALKEVNALELAAEKNPELRKYMKALREDPENVARDAIPAGTFSQGFIEAAEKAAEAAGKVGEAGKLGAEVFNESVKGMTNVLTEFVKTGKLEIEDLGNSIIDMMIRTQMQSFVEQGVMPLLSSLSKSMFGTLTQNAHGNAFSQGKVMAFASGGIVNSPTTFPMQGGTGLMGEAGPEAILPLKRTSGGDLGVRATGGRGGGDVYVTVNNAPDGSSADVSTSKNEDGSLSVVVDLMKSEVARDIATRGTIGQTMESTYSLSRQRSR